MPKLFTPEAEQYAFDSSLVFNGIVAFSLLLILYGYIQSLVTGESSPGIGIIVGILGPLFLIIAFVRNITFIFKTWTRGRKIYAITASLITGALVMVLFWLLFRNLA